MERRFDNKGMFLPNFCLCVSKEVVWVSRELSENTYVRTYSLICACMFVYRKYVNYFILLDWDRRLQSCYYINGQVLTADSTTAKIVIIL